MEKRICKSGSILLLLLLLGPAGITAQELTKDFHKEWKAGPSTTLEISNRYGKVLVETTDQNDIVVNAKVTVEYPNRERAQKLLDYITVQFSEDGDLLKARTVIDEKFKFSGWGAGSRRFSIDYEISMPSRINFTLVNRYGNSDIDDIEGQVKIDIKYGDLNAGNFTRGNVKPLNYISLAYGNADIQSAGWLDALVRYSGRFEIGKCQALLLDSKYSKIMIEEVSSLISETRYDKINIESINNLVLDAGYSDINVGELTKKLKFDGGYGSLTVEDIPAGFESVETNSKYIGVTLGIADNASYQLDARMSYGSLKFDETNFKFNRRIVENNSSETSGIIGQDESPVSKVKVTASYGSVKLY